MMGPGWPHIPFSSDTPMLESGLPREAPFFMEPVEAWRVWNVDVTRPKRGPFLRSITYRVAWPERAAFHAHCLRQIKYQAAQAAVIKHESPDANHRCGIYALRDEDDTFQWVMGTYGSTQHIRVAGQVKLWGRVFQYEKGYIAEYAYPKSIIKIVTPGQGNPDESYEIVRELVERYGIELDLRGRIG